jgi:DNA repair protein SbcD/Mre11
MRLLHTSDWHLGRSFHGESLLDQQDAVLDRIVEICRQEAVDLVVIAGDLYDRAIPPATAVALFTETVRRLRADGAVVVAIAGNHDSHVRVAVYDELLTALGVTVRGDWRRSHEPLLVPPRRGGSPLAVYPLPFLEPLLDGPALAREAGLPEGEARRHQQVIDLALARIRADLASRPGQRSLLVAHAFVAGGRSSESERELSVGNLDVVAVPSFAGFDVVALGHLHAAQELDGARLAYSGSPLPYSFSEEGQQKSVRLVEINDRGLAAVQVIPLRVGRELRSLEGPLEALLQDPQLEDARHCWVRAVLTDGDLPRQAMARLRQRFPHAVELRHRPLRQASMGTSARTQQIRAARGPLERILAFYSDQQGRDPSPAEIQLLRQALSHAGRDES